MYKTLKVTIDGIAPLLMHNARLNDPLDPMSVAIRKITTKKSKEKTQADLEMLARLEWEGGLYVDEENHPIIPGENLEGMIRDAAKKNRLGKQVLAGLMCDGVFRLKYDGPKSLDELWECGRFRDTRRAGVKGSGVMRTRPRFDKWGLSFTVSYMPDVLNKDSVIEAIKIGGRLIGLCDFRPKFGRFDVTKIE